MRSKPFITRRHLFFGALGVAAFVAEATASNLGWKSSNSMALSALFLPILGGCTAKSAEPLQTYPSYQDELGVVAENSLSKKKEIEENVVKKVASLLQIRNETGILDGFRKYLTESLYPQITATLSLIRVLGSNLHSHIQAFLLKLILSFNPYLNYRYLLQYKNTLVDLIEYAFDRRNVMVLKILLETEYFQNKVIQHTEIAEEFKADITKLSETLKNIPQREEYLGDTLQLGSQSFHLPYSFREKLGAAMHAVAQHLYASRTLLLESLNALASCLSSLSPETHALSNPYFSLDASFFEAEAIVKTKNLDTIREYISSKSVAKQSEAAGLVILASNFVDGKPLHTAIVELAFSFNPILDLVRAGKSMLGYAVGLLDVRTTLLLLRGGGAFIDSEIPAVNAIILKHLQEGPERTSLFYRTKNGDERTLFALDRQLLRQTFKSLKAALEAGMRTSFPQFRVLAEEFIKYLDITDSYAREKMRIDAAHKDVDEIASYGEYIRKKILLASSRPAGYVEATNRSGYPLEVYAQQIAPTPRVIMLYEEDVHQIWSMILRESRSMSKTRDQSWMEKISTFFSYAIRFPQNIFFGGVAFIFLLFGRQKYQKAKAKQKPHQHISQTVAQQKTAESIHNADRIRQAEKLLEENQTVPEELDALETLNGAVESLLREQSVKENTQLKLGLTRLKENITPCLSSLRRKRNTMSMSSSAGRIFVSRDSGGGGAGSSAAKESKKTRKQTKSDIKSAAAVTTQKIKTEKDLRPLDGELAHEQTQILADFQKYLKDFSSEFSVISNEVRTFVQSYDKQKVPERGHEEYRRQFDVLQTRINLLKEKLINAQAQCTQTCDAFNTKLREAKENAEHHADVFFSFKHLQELNFDAEFIAKIRGLVNLSERMAAIEIKILPSENTVEVVHPRGEAAAVARAADEAERIELDQIMTEAIIGVADEEQEEWNQQLRAIEAENVTNAGADTEEVGAMRPGSH